MLAGLDADRRSGGELAGHGGVVRERSADGAECRITYSRCTAEEIDEVIAAETALARSGGYTLEWKTYGHDEPPDLGTHLVAAGFTPEDPENVLALPLDDATLTAFDPTAFDIRRVTDPQGLADYAEISREIGRRNVDAEQERLARILRDTPEAMSIHIAYVGDEPVAAGRIYFKQGSRFAELAGARTKTTHRRRGLFIATVGARLHEARDRSRTHVFVDALPTSEPTLSKRGFKLLTRTQPYIYEPKSHAGPQPEP
ncbi:hypothetical protein HerbRD11066_00270 [Herbidospora sp. RD11066]